MSTPFDFPSVLTSKLTPLKYDLQYNSDLLGGEEPQSSLSNLLSGQSLYFLENLIETFSERKLLDKYIGRIILKDCESIRRLYDHCLRRNYELKQTLNLSDPFIPQNKLDDYLIRAAFETDSSD